MIVLTDADIRPLVIAVAVIVALAMALGALIAALIIWARPVEPPTHRRRPRRRAPDAERTRP